MMSEQYSEESTLTMSILLVQKVLSSSGRAVKLRLMGKYNDYRLVARPELDNTFGTASFVSLG